MLATRGETRKRQWQAESKLEALILRADRRFGPVPDGLPQGIGAGDAVVTVEQRLDRLLDAPSLKAPVGAAH